MKKIINLNDSEIKFEFLENGNCWRTENFIKIDNHNLEIEIDFSYHNEDINWEDFKKFYRFISQKGFLEKYLKETKKLTQHFAETVFRNIVPEWKVEFADLIYYRGIKQRNYYFSLVYNYYHPNKGEGDDYASYLVSYMSNNLVSIERV